MSILRAIGTTGWVTKGMEASADELNAVGSESRPGAERGEGEPWLLNQDKAHLPHHSHKVLMFWAQLTRCIYKGLRDPKQAERKQQNQVRTKSLLCWMPKGEQSWRRKNRTKMAKTIIYFQVTWGNPPFACLLRQVRVEQNLTSLNTKADITELFNFPYNPLENLQGKFGKCWKNKSNFLVLQLEI